MVRFLFRLAISGALLAACGGDGSGSSDSTDTGGDVDADTTPEPTADGGPDATPPDCPSVIVDTTPVVPTVQLLIDQSGSMTATFGNTNRWDAVVDALTNPTTGVVTELEHNVIFGVSMYSGGNTCPRLDTIMPAIDNYQDIRDLLLANDPRQETPTPESMTAVTALLTALPEDPAYPGSPKIIVLATDGEPDTCANPDQQNAQPQSVAAVQAAFNAGIRVFILSVGDEVSNGHQQDMANAGVGKPLDGSQGNAPFYNADDPAELAAAFDTIIGGVRECTFSLDKTVGPAAAAQGDVRLNDQPLVYNDPNGWTLVDSTTIRLEGTACETFKSSAQAELVAEFPCGSVIE